MKLKVFRALWGMDEPLDAAVQRIAREDYDGVDAVLQAVDGTDLRSLLRDHDLALVMGIVEMESIDALARNLEKALRFEPERLYVHAGADAWSRDEGCRFFEQALQLQDRLGRQIGFETHRGRLLNNPWDTLFYLQRFPELRINADFSHWVCVCERLIDEDHPSLNLACRRVIHIHARVGYEQGPQVPDPSDPAYAPQLAWHEKQWGKIRRCHEETGQEFLTATVEYGPPPYLHVLPHTQTPVADLSTVCLWAANRLRQHWSEQA